MSYIWVIQYMVYIYITHGTKNCNEVCTAKTRKNWSENRQLQHRLPHGICNINIYGPHIIGYSTCSWPHNQFIYFCFSASIVPIKKG